MREFVLMTDSDTEIPYTFAERQTGESKIDSQVTIQYLKQCVDLRKRAVKDNKTEVIRWTSQETDEKVSSFIGG